MSIAMRACAAVAALSAHWAAAAGPSVPAIPIEWKATGVVTTVGGISAGDVLAGALPGDRLLFHARFDSVNFWSEPTVRASLPYGTPGAHGTAVEALSYRLTSAAPVASVSITRDDVIIATYSASEMFATVHDERAGAGAGRDAVEFTIVIDPHSLPEDFSGGARTLELSIIAVGPESALDSAGFPLSLSIDDFTSVEFTFTLLDEDSGETRALLSGVIEEWSWAVVPAPGSLSLSLLAIPVALRRRR